VGWLAYQACIHKLQQGWVRCFKLDLKSRWKKRHSMPNDASCLSFSPMSFHHLKRKPATSRWIFYTKSGFLMRFQLEKHNSIIHKIDPFLISRFNFSWIAFLNAWSSFIFYFLNYKSSSQVFHRPVAGLFFIIKINFWFF